MRVKRLLSWSAASLLLAGCLFFWLAYTASGLRTVLKLASALTPMEIRHTNLSGNLADLYADALSVKTPDLTVTVEQAQLRWQPFSLLRNSFRAEQVHLANLIVTTPTSTEVTESNFQNPRDFRFPVDISVADLRIDKLSVNDFVLAQKISATAKLTDERWSVPTAAAQLEYGAVTVSADVYPERNWEHSVQLRLEEPQLGPVQLVFNGDQELTEGDATVAAVGGNAQIRIADPFAQFRWNLALAVDHLTPLDRRGNIQLQGSGAGYTGVFQAEGSIDEVEIRDTIIELERQGATLLTKVAGAVNDWPLTVSAKLGEQGISDGSILVGSTEVTNQVAVRSANISIDGSWQRLAVNATSDLLLKVPGRLALKGELLDFKSAQFSHLELQLADGSINGQAEVDFQEGLQIQANLRARDIDLQRFESRLPGSLSSTLSVTSKNGQTRFELSNINASSPAAEGPITGSGKVLLAGATVQSAQLDLSVDSNNHIHLDKQGSQERVSLDFTIANLGAFINGANGEANGDLVLDLDTLFVAGEINLESLSVPELFNLKNTNVIASHEAGLQQLSISGESLTYNDIDLPAFEFNLHGSRDAQAILGTVTFSDEHLLGLAVDGAWVDQQWRYQINRFDLNYGDLKAALSSPAQGVVANNASELSPMCIVLNRSGEACASYQMSGKDLRANVVVTLNSGGASMAPLLAQFELPPMEFSAGGNLTLDIDRQNGVLRTLKLDATIPVVSLETQEGEAIEIRSVTAFATGDQQLVSLNAGMQIAGGTITTQAQIGNLDVPTLDATVNLELPELAALTALFTELDLQSGKLDGTFTLAGALSSPTYSGELNTHDLKLAWPSLGTQHEGELRVDFGSGKSGDVRGRLISPNGEASVQGTVQFTPVPEVKLTITGEQFLIADKADLAVSASPNLQLMWHDQEISITGDIAIDRAFSSLDFPAIQSQVVLSNDIVFADQQQDADLRKTAGAEIDIGVEFAQPGKVSGRGINGDVSGKLRVTQKPGAAALARGFLSLTGTYQAFGQELDIENGRLIYTNTPIGDPVINVYASRKVDDVTVGVRVGGRASALVTRLESTPAMPESDVLHYLVLGRAPDASTNAESNQLASAAISLAISQSEVGVQSIGEKLGVTDLGITQEFGALALAVGKQLSPTLYVSYTVGLLEPLDVAKIRYTLSRRLSLEAEVSDETRASLRYRIEKD